MSDTNSSSSQLTASPQSTSSYSPVRPTRGRGRPRGRGRGRGVGVRGGRRGRGGVGAAGPLPQTRADEALGIISSRNERMKTAIAKMSPEKMRETLLSMVDHHPGLVFNIIEPAEVHPEGYHPPEGSSQPDWCVCTRCREMPTNPERVCCQKAPENCISCMPDMRVLCLDENVLAMARLYTRDLLVLPKRKT